MLDQRLRDHNESLARPLTVAEVFGRESTSHRPSPDDGQPSHRWLAAAAVVLFAMIGGSVALLWLPSSGQPLATDGGFSAPEGLPVLSGDLSNAEWREIQDPFPVLEAGQRATVIEVVVVDGVAWAVGHVSSPDGLENRRSPLQGVVWRSDDGERWAVADVGSIVSNPAPEGTELVNFYDVVATEDGAIWALGGEVVDESNSGFPIGAIYRTSDGDTWERIEFPDLVGLSANAFRASADGDELVVVVDSFDLGFDRGVRSVLRTDGLSWSEVRGDTPEDLHALLHDGELADVSGEEFDEAGFFSTELVAGPDFFVATGGALGDVVLEVLEGESSPSVEPLFWSSTDSQQWSPLEVPQVERAFRVEPRLFAHTEGVLASASWGNPDSGEAGVSLFNIDGQQVVEYLGELPVTWQNAMFVMDGQVFVVGIVEGGVEGNSVWVAELEGE